jgi:hypothetical protein
VWPALVEVYQPGYATFDVYTLEDVAFGRR